MTVVAPELLSSISSEAVTFPLSVETLKTIKNIVVGNPRAKLKVLEDSKLLTSLVELCDPKVDSTVDGQAARMESTVIIGSLAHADPPTRTLQVLLSTPVITYLVLAIQQASTQSATTHTSRAVVLKDLETTLKTLANLVKLIRDFCDRGRWGTGIDAPRGKNSANPAGVASDENAARVLVGNKIGEILEPPLLALLLSLIPARHAHSTSARTPQASTTPSTNRPSSQTAAILPTVLTLLTSLIHTPAHRRAVLASTSSHTAPFSHPQLPYYGSPPRALYSPSAVSKGKQRATSFSFASSGTGSNDVLAKVVALLGPGAGDAKIKNAALSLLSALAKEEWVGLELRGMLEPGGKPVIDHLGELSNSRDIGVQIAAVEVLATIYRSTRSHASSSDDHLDDWLPMMEDLSRLLGESGEERIRATFIMAYLIADDLPLQTAAAESDVLRRLEYILEESAGDGNGRGSEDEMDMDLGEEDLDGKARLREGALLLLSTLTLHLPHLRSHLLTILPDLLPTTLLNSLSHPTSSGVRAAAAQLARGLSRSVCVLRSSLVDAKGVVERLIEMVLDADGREKDEVKSGVVAVLGNLGLEFAPMKQMLIERGVLEVLASFCEAGTMADLRLNAIWALKNMAYRSSWAVKCRLIDDLTHPRLYELLSSSSPPEMQAQAFALLRNLLADSSESEIEDFITVGLTKLKFEAVIDEKTSLLRTGLDTGEEEVVYQAVYVLACVVAGSEQLRRWVVGSATLVGALKLAITAPSTQIRTAACIACLNLVDDPSPFRRGQALEQLRFSGIQDAVFLYPTDLPGSGVGQGDEDSSAELWGVRTKLIEFLRS